jgi:hypothetical protein
VSVDVMHDVFEDVSQYDLAKILDHYIYTKRYFTLSQFNDRILAFPYEQHENAPPTFSESNIKKKLKLSCSEMITLVRDFTFLIGDLIPKDDDYWQLILSFQTMVDEIMSQVYTRDTPKILKIIIYEYLSMLNELFPNSMKPKQVGV